MKNKGTLTGEIEKATGEGQYEKHLVPGVTIVALFVLPMLLGTSQLVLGSIINGILVFVGRHGFSRVERVVACLVPSLSTLVSGFLFGPLTIFLVFLLPGIWAGNYVLVISVDLMRNFDTTRKKAFFGFLGVSLKTVVIGAIYMATMAFGLVPGALFLNFTLIQSITATIGLIGETSLEIAWREKKRRA